MHSLFESEIQRANRILNVLKQHGLHTQCPSKQIDVNVRGVTTFVIFENGHDAKNCLPTLTTIFKAANPEHMVESAPKFAHSITGDHRSMIEINCVGNFDEAIVKLEENAGITIQPAASNSSTPCLIM